jgi:hypothetical protein
MRDLCCLQLPDSHVSVQYSREDPISEDDKKTTPHEQPIWRLRTPTTTPQMRKHGALFADAFHVVYIACRGRIVVNSTGQTLFRDEEQKMKASRWNSVSRGREKEKKEWTSGAALHRPALDRTAVQRRE